MNSPVIASLLFLGIASVATIAMAQSSGTFRVTGNLTTARHSHTTALLTDGRVLIAGGVAGNGTDSVYLASAELYDPSTGTFAATGDMSRPRAYNTATLLPNGKVLIAGGRGGLDLYQAGAELYDPSAGTFTAVGEMTTGRIQHSATLLPNGKVLIAGGWGIGPNAPNGHVSTAELYEPSTETFTAAGETNVRGPVKSCLLSNGKVLINGINQSGGVSAEIYDPDTGSFSLTGIGRTTEPSMAPFTANLLTSGKVLVTLWWDIDFPGGAAEVYDPSTGTFTAAPGNTAHLDYLTSATLLPNGAVFLAGRYYTELYDAGTGIFSGTGAMLTNSRVGGATLLPDGTVLMSGGWICCGTPATTSASAEIYHPAVLIPAPVLLSLSSDGRGQGAIQHAGTSRIASATDPALAGEYLTIYGTGLLDGSVIPPQVAIGGRLAEILFFGNTPGFPGLNQINVRVPGGVVPGPAVPVRLNYLGRPSNEVTIGVR